MAQNDIERRKKPCGKMFAGKGAVIDYYQSERGCKAPNKYISKQIACFYGSEPVCTYKHIHQITHFIENMFERVEAEFDLQRADKYKRKYTLYIAQTGLGKPSDRECGANRWLMVIDANVVHRFSAHLPTIISYIGDAVFLCDHHPMLAQSLSTYLVHYYLPTNALIYDTMWRYMLAYHYKNHFGCVQYFNWGILWVLVGWICKDDVGQRHAAKAIGDIADFVLMNLEHNDDVFKAVANWLHVSTSELFVKYLEAIPELKFWRGNALTFNAMKKSFADPEQKFYDGKLRWRGCTATCIEDLERLERYGFEVLHINQFVADGSDVASCLPKRQDGCEWVWHLYKDMVFIGFV